MNSIHTNHPNKILHVVQISNNQTWQSFYQDLKILFIEANYILYQVNSIMLFKLAKKIK